MKSSPSGELPKKTKRNPDEPDEYAGLHPSKRPKRDAPIIPPSQNKTTKTKTKTAKTKTTMNTAKTDDAAAHPPSLVRVIEVAMLVGESNQIGLYINLDCSAVLKDDLVWGMVLASDEYDQEVNLAENPVGPFEEIGSYGLSFEADLPDGFSSFATERVLVVSCAYQGTQLIKFACLVMFR